MSTVEPEEEEEQSFVRILLRFPEKLASNPDPRMIKLLEKNIDKNSPHFSKIVRALANNDECQDAVDLALHLLGNRRENYFLDQDTRENIFEILSANPLAFKTLKKHPKNIVYSRLHRNPHPGAVKLLKNLPLEDNIIKSGINDIRKKSNC